MNKKLFFLSILFSTPFTILHPQSSNLSLGLETWAGYTSNGQVPFWLRSNQFGSVPIAGPSLSLIASARKDYDLNEEKLFDWGFSAEGRGNLGQGSNIKLIEGYGKLRLGIFELRAGRSKKITGLCDTTLTSGSWAISGTNLGIPEVELSVCDFWLLPWFGQLFAFKGNFAHGWFGEVPMKRWFDNGDTVQIKTYLHQKSLYGRFGKPSWRFKLYGGFNHQVTWGNESDFYTRDFELSPIYTYLYVITGRRYSNGFIESTRLGNHLGSIDLGFEYNFDEIRLLLYRQNFYDSGALSTLSNVQDGLNGISLTNLTSNEAAFKWNKLLVEFLYTKNQGGEPWSPEYGSSYEGYFNHGEYIGGWSYKGNDLGSPFVSNKYEVRQGFPSGPDENFINNRLFVIHFASEGQIKNLRYLIKCSYSQNYGTYWTTDEEQSTDIPNPGAYGIFGEQRQFSAYFELNKSLVSGWNLALIGAGDVGQLYYNSFGIFFKASYSFYL